MGKRQWDSTVLTNIGVPDQIPRSSQVDDPTLISDHSWLIGILIQGLKCEHFDAYSLCCYYNQWDIWMCYAMVGSMLTSYKTVNIIFEPTVLYYNRPEGKLEVGVA